MSKSMSSQNSFMLTEWDIVALTMYLANPEFVKKTPNKFILPFDFPLTFLRTYRTGPKWRRYSLRLALFVFIAATAFYSVHLLMRCFDYAIRPNDHRNRLVKFVVLLPFLLTTIRGAVCVTFFLKGSDIFIQACRDLEVLVVKVAPTVTRENAKRWRLISAFQEVMVTFYAFAFMCINAASWLLDDRETWWHASIRFSPFEWSMNIVPYMIVQVFLCNFPHIFAQFIFSYAATCGIILSDCTDSLLSMVNGLAASDRQAILQSAGLLAKDPKKIKGEKYVRITEKEIAKLHCDLHQIVQQLNTVFSPIFLTTYVLDVVGFFGCCGIVVSETFSQTQFDYKVFVKYNNLAVFGLSSMLPYIPLVFIHEKAAKLPSCIYKIMRNGSRQAEAFRDLLQQCRDLHMDFHAAGVMHISRGFIFKTLTLFISAAIGISEILLMEEQSDKLAASLRIRNCSTRSSL